MFYLEGVWESLFQDYQFKVNSSQVQTSVWIKVWKKKNHFIILCKFYDGWGRGVVLIVVFFQQICLRANCLVLNVKSQNVKHIEKRLKG